MTIIYTLVGIIALCGVIGAYKFFTVSPDSKQLKHWAMTTNDSSDNHTDACECMYRQQLTKDQKHIDFINNYEYCPKKEDNDA